MVKYWTDLTNIHTHKKRFDGLIGSQTENCAQNWMAVCYKKCKASKLSNLFERSNGRQMRERQRDREKSNSRVVNIKLHSTPIPIIIIQAVCWYYHHYYNDYFFFQNFANIIRFRWSHPFTISRAHNSFIENRSTV